MPARVLVEPLLPLHVQAFLLRQGEQPFLLRQQGETESLQRQRRQTESLQRFMTTAAWDAAEDEVARLL